MDVAEGRRHGRETARIFGTGAVAGMNDVDLGGAHTWQRADLVCGAAVLAPKIDGMYAAMIGYEIDTFA